jgi:SAM-dependent methyltransferase
MDSVHRVPRAALVDRSERLVELARGKQVIDLGFVDVGRMLAKREDGSWLHERLHTVASGLVGIDFDEEGVELARRMGFTAERADCQNAADLESLGLRPAEVIIAGELIEHLDQPGAFLEAVKVLVDPKGLLVLTTPNGSSLTNFLGGLLGREFVNPDHVAWHTWYTVKSLLGRHGWLVRQLVYYRFPTMSATAEHPLSQRLLTRLFHSYQTLARPLFRIRPGLADGIIVVASLAERRTESRQDGL